MKVEIWSDFVSPLCYVAKRKFELALERFNKQQYVKVEYKSYLLHSNRQEAANTYEQLLANTCNVPVCNIKEWIEQIKIQANELNLPLTLEHYTFTNTLDAHRLVKFATKKGKGVEMIDLLFTHFFSHINQMRGNIDCKETLLHLGTQCGLGKREVERMLSVQKYRRGVEEDEYVANEIGIENIPFFIFNEKHAVVGNQSVDVFLQVLEEVWQEDKERLFKKQMRTRATSFCEGEDCDVQSKK